MSSPRAAAAHVTGRPPAACRTPFAPAAVALAVFAAAGIAILDDYGVAVDEDTQRLIGQQAVNYVLPGAAVLPADRLLSDPDYGPAPEAEDRYYGVAFEAPLILAERLLGLADSRAVFLTRHLLTHLFFLAGGWFCYLLVYRLFGDRYLALFALLLFLLHPRLYAHSFFNTKDLPFLAMFMIALYLLERACRRGTAAAFALSGAGVGVLVNLRVMGVMLFAAALALRALDLLQARSPAQRRRVVATAGAFALAAAGTLYAVSPYLWRDPLAIVEVFTTFTAYRFNIATLFQGELVNWPRLPAHYLPTWMAITTPPATLLLCLVGAAAALAQCAARPRNAAANTAQRFTLLLAACLALPVAAVMALRPNLYEGWRHLFFLYAPVCLLAVCGLRALLAGARRLAAQPRLRLRRSSYLRRGVYALAAAALAGMAVEIVRLHPQQHGYFNFLVDRRTPEYLRTQYRMLFWGTEVRQGLEELLARYPGAALRVDGKNLRHVWRNRLILPAAERRRIVIADAAERSPQFFIDRNPVADPIAPVVYARRIYHNTVLTVTAADLALLDPATAAGYRAAYRTAYHAAVAGEPLLRSEWDLYLDGATLTYVKESCRPEDTVDRFLLHVVPAAVDDLPSIDREGGRQRLGFPFARFGVRFDGRCLIRRRLPDYPIRALELGRRIPEAPNQRLLEAVVDLAPEQPPVSFGRYWSAHAAIAAGERGAPAARSGFDLYLDAAGTELTYHKEPCAPGDLWERFYLHVFPVDASDLAAEERQAGFYGHSFLFPEHGVLLRGGACVALVPLPRFRSGIGYVRAIQGALWTAEFRGDVNRYRQAHAAIAGGGRGAPAARSGFDLYLDAAGTELTYYKEPCAPEDLQERFFLHVFPADASELAAEERQAGFYNRSFTWAEHGARLDAPDADAACVALVPLPVYEGGIAHVRTGQFDGWIAEFPAGLTRS